MLASEGQAPDSSKTDLNLNDWLRQQPSDNYTLQLASVVNKNDIIQYLKESGFGNNAGYIEVIVNDIPRYTAIYGLFGSYQNAQLAIDELPSSIQSTKPWVRNTGILQELLR